MFISITSAQRNVRKLDCLHALLNYSHRVRVLCVVFVWSVDMSASVNESKTRVWL